MPAPSRRRGSAAGPLGPRGRLRAGHRLPGRTPLGFGEVARLFAAASAWDVVTPDRPRRGAGRPGRPRDAALDHADEQARDAILASLAAPEVQRIRFVLGDISVDPALFAGVAEAVRGGTISAVALEADAAAPVQALYSPGLDAFCLRAPAELPVGKQAAVLREALHAGLLREGQQAAAELLGAAGLVVEALRIALATPEPGGIDPAALPSRPRRAAMRLALRLLDATAGRDVAAADSDCVELCAALVESPEAERHPGAALGRLPPSTG